MANQALTVVPSNLQLPAHLQSPDIAASIAAANAAAAGGVRAGGFPTISIKSNHFHIKDGDETTTLLVPATQPGQPALPMMCLEVVVIDANPALTHTYFAGEYVEGEALEPACRSANGITPDADSPAVQHTACATCPQYQWGSKISKLSGKPIRACGDSKQLAVVPAGDLNYKMLGLQVKAGSLKNWGTYVQALSGRGYGIATLVTNITFDQSANGVLQFSFNRFLTEAEYLKANERKDGDDVKLIVAQSRSMAPAAAQLAAPANHGLPAPDVAPPAYVAAMLSPQAPAAAVAAMPAPVTAFAGTAETNFPSSGGPDGGDSVSTAPTGPTAAAPFAGLPAHVSVALDAVGGLNSPAGLNMYKALTGIDYMELVKAASAAPAASAEPPKRSRRTRAEMEAAKTETAPVAPPAPVVDLSHIPANIMAAISAVGADSPAGLALIAAYPKPEQAAPPVTAPVAAPVTAPVTAPAAFSQSGFGAAAQAAPAQRPTAQVVASGASLADKLRAKLGGTPS